VSRHITFTAEDGNVQIQTQGGKKSLARKEDKNLKQNNFIPFCMRGGSISIHAEFE